MTFGERTQDGIVGAGHAWRRRARAMARTVMRAAEYAAPATGARLAAGAARRVPARVRSRPTAPPGAQITLLVGAAGRRVTGATEARGRGPLVYLLDGYHGKGRMRELGAALAGAGYRAVAVIVPAHRPDGPRRYQRGIVPEYVAALEAAVARHGAPAAVIGHSLGGYAAQLAVLGGLPGTPCLVLIEALPDATSIARALARQAGLGRRTQARLPRVLARQAGLTIADADAAARAREDASPRRVLVIWDDSSDFVQASASLDLACAWSADSFRTSARGHVGLLRDPGLHARVIAHLDQSAGSTRRARAYSRPSGGGQ